MTAPSRRVEALRQQALLAVLAGDAPPQALDAWLRERGPRARRGLQAHRAHAAALAERALASFFPTVAQWLGPPAFAAMAQAFWQACPPVRGDVAQWGGALPDFIAAAADLAAEPGLPDLARLEWAVQQADMAADAGEAGTGLDLLATADPLGLWLQLPPGTAVLSSPHPVATIWLAHRSAAADRFAPVRQALAQGGGEHALIWRQGWRAQVHLLTDHAACFTRAVLAGRPVGQALHDAGPAFDFEAWLLAALRQGWLVSVATRRPDALASAPHACT